MFHCLVKFYLLLWTVSVCSGTSEMEARFESASPLAGEEETLALFNLRLVGKQRLLNGTVIFLVDLDETFEMTITLSSFKNGEWVQANIRLRTTPCDAVVNYIRKYYIPPDADSSLPLTLEDCLLASQPWEFYLKNVKPTTDNWPPFISRSLVKFTVHILSKGKRIGGIEINTSVVDKQH